MSPAEFPVSAVVSFSAAFSLGGAPHAAPQAEAQVQVQQRQVEQQVQRQVEQAVQHAVRAAQAGEHAERLEAELAKAREAVANIQTSPGGGTVSITKDGSGNVVIRTPDGKNVIIGEGILPPGAIEGMVASMAPPNPPPFIPHDQGPPDGVLALIGIIFGCLTVMVVGWPIARAFGRRVETRAAAPGFPVEVAHRLERIEQAVDAVAVEVERVSEAQRYSARLLTERLPDQVPHLAGAQGAARPTPDRG